MTRPAAAPQDPDPSTENPLCHTWVGAATVPLTEKRAKHANLRLSYRADQDDRIDVLDVYCSGCRRPYDDVADRSCEAKIDNTHLIGGNPGERAKRKHFDRPAGAVVMPGPRINRRGITAYVHGGATASDD